MLICVYLNMHFIRYIRYPHYLNFVLYNFNLPICNYYSQAIHSFAVDATHFIPIKSALISKKFVLDLIESVMINLIVIHYQSRSNTKH